MTDNDPNPCAFMADEEGFLHDPIEFEGVQRRRTARWRHQRYHGRRVRWVARRLRPMSASSV